MQWMIPSLIATISCTAVLALVYGYLYHEYRERHLILWTMSWTIYCLRYGLMLLLVLFSENIYLLIGNQIASLVSGFFLFWGTYSFIGKKMPRFWVYLAAADILWIVYASFMHVDFTLLTLSTFIFLAFVFIWTGICIIRSKMYNENLKTVIGITFIIWGLHKANYPVIRPIEWLAPWGYLISAIIALFVALGFILLYFEKNRHDHIDSENRFRRLFEESNDAVFITDSHGVILDINKAALLMLNMSIDDLSSRNLVSLAPIHEQAAIKLALEQIVQNRFIRFESVLEKKDGTGIWVDVSAKVIDPEKMIIQAIIRNITDLKMTLEALKRSERKYRALFGSMNEGVVLHKAVRDENAGEVTDFVAIDFNQRYRMIFDCGEITGRRGSEVYQTEIFEWFGATIGKVLRTRTIQFSEVTFSLLKRTLKTSSFAISEDEVATVFDDITEKRRLEEQLLQTQKMESVSQLAGGIAHDFNNMLSAIMGYSEMIIQNMSQEDPNYPDVKDIITATQRAANLTSQLLAFSRKQLVEPKVVNINTLIKDLRKMLERLIGEHMEILLKPADTLWNVRIDPGQFGQIVTNLIVNARDAMPNGGTITVTTENVTVADTGPDLPADIVPGEYVAVAIRDTGIGMKDDIIKHIFEPFFTTKETGKGTGLGLSTCYGIVKQNDGYIKVESILGIGSIFTVYLPRVIEEKTEDAKHAAVTSPTGGNETVLVTEDEEPLRKMIVRALTSKGYTVLEASNGLEALSVLDAEPERIELLITDVIMPKMGGVELVERIRADHPGIKIIFMSGYTDNTEFRVLKRSSGLDFIQKPFSPLILMELVRKILDTKNTD